MVGEALGGIDWCVSGKCFHTLPLCYGWFEPVILIVGVTANSAPKVVSVTGACAEKESSPVACPLPIFVREEANSHPRVPPWVFTADCSMGPASLTSP